MLRPVETLFRRTEGCREAFRELNNAHGIRPKAHAALVALLPSRNNASDADAGAASDCNPLLESVALSIDKLRLMLRRFEDEGDDTLLGLLPRHMDALLASEALVDNRPNLLLQPLGLILASGRLGLVFAVRVFALCVWLGQVRVARGHDFGNEGDVLELLASHGALSAMARLHSRIVA